MGSSTPCHVTAMDNIMYIVGLFWSYLLYYFSLDVKTRTPTIKPHICVVLKIIFIIWNS